MMEKYGLEIFIGSILFLVVVALSMWIWRKTRTNGIDALTSLIGMIGREERLNPNDRYRLYRRVFIDTAEGRKVLNDILANSHIYHTSHTSHGKYDALNTAFLEGERNVALRIIHTINKEPADMPTKAKEAK